jgi:glucose-6-phosphate-specific signal transduction histidine kinase
MNRQKNLPCIPFGIYSGAMNRYLFTVHDLNNKLLLLYAHLWKHQQGKPPSKEQSDAVIVRINEIMASLYQDFRPGFENDRCLETLDQDEISSLIDCLRIKSAGIFPDIEIKAQTSSIKWENRQKIQINKDLLYQVFENAIENSRNAKSTEVHINLIFQPDHVVIELRDNGEGFKEHKKAERLIPHATGIIIIKENIRSMGAKLEYLENMDTGVTLQLIFPVCS